MPDLIIDDQTSNDVLFPKTMARGYVERDYKLYPEEMFAPPSELQIYPRSEWSARIKEKNELKSNISDVRNRADNGQRMKSLDQNGQGFCWAYSVTATVMLVRAINNVPFARLSAHAVGCKVKNFRDEGGWCGLSAKFIREHGVPSVEFWKEKSMSRTNDTPETWANAAQHTITEDWVDLTRQVYDQNLTFDQLATCLLAGIPCAVDFNWWGHSVCAMDLVEVEPGSFGIRILNSWTDGWGEYGTSVLRGSKAVPNGALATRVVGAAA